MTRAGFLEGVRGITTLALAVLPFGIAYGVAATAAGMSPALTIAMSTTVYAGAAQFTLLQFWPPTPEMLAGMLSAILAVNARLLVYGATLAPWLVHAPVGQRCIGAFFLSDESWALASRRYAEGGRDIGILIGAGVTLWTAWVLGTVIGVQARALPFDPKMFGLDMLMAAFFVAVLSGSWTGQRDIIPWLAAATAALVSAIALPAGYAVLISALACGIAGMALKPGASHA